MDTNNGVKYELVERDGQIVRRYADGALRNEQGHLIAPHPKAMRFDSETGTQAVEKRWQQHREGYVQGVIEGAGLPENAGSADAWRALARKATETFMKSENSRGLAELLKTIGEQAGFTPPTRSVNATQNNFYGSTAEILDAMLANPTLRPTAELLLTAARRRLQTGKDNLDVEL